MVRSFKMRFSYSFKKTPDPVMPLIVMFVNVPSATFEKNITEDKVTS